MTLRTGRAEREGQEPSGKPVRVAEAEKPLELWAITKTPSGVQAGSEPSGGPGSATRRCLQIGKSP